MRRELEEENSQLQAEYERLRSKGTPESTPEELRSGGGGDMVAEARLLRQHKGRLEARMQILEDHNRQLEAQLQRLRQLLDEVSVTKLVVIIFLFLANQILMLLKKKESHIVPSINT